jgi:CheY-like chemotaxis protein
VPKSFVCDGKKIENILLNLVDNGLKFTKTGFVKVKVQIKKEHPEHNSIDLLIIVEDSGVGIAKENRESIFNVFVKHEDTPDMLAKGLGIGLSINKKMVSVMNASLSVESKLGVGSRFTFLLNDLEVVLVSAEDETKDEYVDFSLVSSKDARVMVIDEDEETHQLIKDSFSASTVVEVLNFTDPRDAVAMFKKKKIDLIFIDIDILTIDENAFSKMIAMMSKAAVITLTQGSIKDIQFLEGGARVIGHLKRPISKVELFKLSMRELNTSSDLS